jgi:hypothetical protein
VSGADVAGLGSPPPDAAAEFCTLVAELAGTLTVSVKGAKLALAATTLEFVQLTVFVPAPLHDQLVPVPDTSV